MHELFDTPDGPERSPRREPIPPRAWSVSQLTQRIRGLLEGLGRVSVEGEVSGGRPAASGHVYFDLKDLDAKVACVIWRSAVATALRQPLREGDKVVVHGKVEVYGPRGGYQIIVQRVEPAGLGTLLAQLERLKQDLKERGWLDRRRPIPALPERVGVVTSRDGAAFQDFLRTRSQRWPLYPVVLSHTPVQGANAAQLIAAAIRRVAASGVDVVVVTRGGGSIEDLWAFNELAVAEAIWECPVPVVSGVGHETDTTLCDLVADLRAHTPTDAATQVIPDRRELVEALERGEGHLLDALQSQLEGRRERLERAASSRVLRDAHWILDER
ncbi:MAG: exodeoxyribonuclease VII large subunit, partial [Planctomycetaceae bacterium]|nr:exodeoxyribonuclease VII large subunit [Planctomycetaceae bacterium]